MSLSALYPNIPAAIARSLASTQFILQFDNGVCMSLHSPDLEDAEHEAESYCHLAHSNGNIVRRCDLRTVASVFLTSRGYVCMPVYTEH